jgi:SAM-dependent methyltransferase
MKVKSVYYRNWGAVPLSSKVTFHVRRKMFQLFMSVMHPSETTSILDLGVTSDEEHEGSNFFERFYPYKHRIVCVGTEDGSHLERAYPGVTFKPIQSGEKLPFSDRQFDIVFSNAVIEHAGAEAKQKLFVQEALRVSKAFFFTTPNRFFPIEMHTGLPLLHFLPKPVHRRLLAKIGHNYWASESNLNLMDAKEFRRLFPDPISVKIAKIRLLGFSSNLAAYCQPPDEHSYNAGRKARQPNPYKFGV